MEISGKQRYIAGMNESEKLIKVAALYHFAVLDDLSAYKSQILDAAITNGIKGTILLADEGINGTIAGAPADIDAMIAYLRMLPVFAGLEVKYSESAEMPFLRMKARLKKEIVAMGIDDIDAARAKGKYVEPADWNALISDPDTIIIDTRNDYEVAIGTFEGAIDPKTKSFREFPGWFDDFSKQLKNGEKSKPKIAMFCTGGIRCEKATAYVKAQGFDDVFHLQGGILKYLESIPEDQSSWNGECFLFDQRVSVGHGLKQGDYEQCHACRRPLSAEDRASEHYIVGESCPYCHHERTFEQRERYRERQRQMEKASADGRQHLAQHLETS